jgi:hypothetical protein
MNAGRELDAEVPKMNGVGAVREATESVGPMSAGLGGEEAARTRSHQWEEMPGGAQQEPGRQRSAQGQPGLCRRSASTAEGLAAPITICLAALKAKGVEV